MRRRGECLIWPHLASRATGRRGRRGGRPGASGDGMQFWVFGPVQEREASLSLT